MKHKYVVGLILALLIFGLAMNAVLTRFYWWQSDDPDPIVAWHESTVNRRGVPSLRIIRDNLLIGKTEAEVIGLMGKTDYRREYEGSTFLGWDTGNGSILDFVSLESHYLQVKLVDGVVVEHSISRQ